MITLKEIEKELGVKFEEKGKMSLVEWLEKVGIPSLARALKTIEDKKPCTICKKYDCNSTHSGR